LSRAETEILFEYCFIENVVILKPDVKFLKIETWIKSKVVISKQALVVKNFLRKIL